MDSTIDCEWLRILNPLYMLEDVDINAVLQLINQGGRFQTPLLIQLNDQPHRSYQAVTEYPDGQVLFRRPGISGGHIKGHWLFVMCDGSTTFVFDSIYDDLDSDCLKALRILYPNCKQVCHVECSRQNDGVSCGLFAIAFLSLYFFGIPPGTVHLAEPKLLRQHLVNILITKVFTVFPYYAKFLNDNQSVSNQIYSLDFKLNEKCPSQCRLKDDTYKTWQKNYQKNYRKKNAATISRRQAEIRAQRKDTPAETAARSYQKHYRDVHREITLSHYAEKVEKDKRNSQSETYKIFFVDLQFLFKPNTTAYPASPIAKKK
jgi:hypothetical protein